MTSPYETALLDFVSDLQKRDPQRPNDAVVIQKLQEAAALLKQDREAIEGTSNG